LKEIPEIKFKVAV